MKICPVNASRLAAGALAVGAIFYGAAHGKKEEYNHPPLVSWIPADHPALTNPEAVPEMPRTHVDFNRVHGARCRLPEVSGQMIGGIQEGAMVYKLTCN